MKITKQISKQKKGAPLELEQPVAMTEAEIIVKPADSSTLEFVAQSEVLEEKIVETERAAEELQDELKRLDQAWSGRRQRRRLHPNRRPAKLWPRLPPRPKRKNQKAPSPT